jgi:uncharacterized RDD family membrane protein YckC
MTALDERLSIDTPENVVFNYEVAGLVTRGLAAFVDSLIITITQALVLGITLGFTGIPSIDDSAIQSWMIALLGFLGFVMLWGYYIFFDLRWNGQSPGKRWLGLRVVCANGTPISLTESLIRNLVRLIDFLPLYYGAGIVMMFVDDKMRRLGDMAAHTLVVRDQKEISLESLKGNSSSISPSISHLAKEVRVARLTSQDIQLMEDYFARRYSLPSKVRSELRQHILHILLTRLDLPADWMSEHSTESRIRLIFEASRTQG